MASARDVVVRAARRIGVLEGGAALSAEDLVNGLQLLNDMMHGLGRRGIKHAHTTLGADDTVNMADEDIRNLGLLLCAELAMDHGRPLDVLLGSAILEATNALQAAYYVPKPSVVDHALRAPNTGAYNIRRA